MLCTMENQVGAAIGLISTDVHVFSLIGKGTYRVHILHKVCATWVGVRFDLAVVFA